MNASPHNSTVTKIDFTLLCLPVVYIFNITSEPAGIVLRITRIIYWRMDYYSVI